MQHFEIIIIGAGAAGLLAAYDLMEKHSSLAILEARERTGGRAHTAHIEGFSSPIETGAEFVHGKLPLTLSLLKKSGLVYHAIEGKQYAIEKNEKKKENEFDAHWSELMQKLKSLETDLPIASFLDLYFPGERYKMLRESVCRFVMGFDAADPADASSKSLLKEWTNDDEENQFRIDKGYSSLLDWMANYVVQQGAKLYLSHPVNTIDHSGENIILNCEDGTNFSCKKLLVTVPLGVWQSSSSLPHLLFTPELPEKQNAANQMGWGNVIKVMVEFTGFFWENNGKRSMPGAGFIFSDAEIPTWWTQNPSTLPQLFGWLAGPPAGKMNLADEEEIKSKCYHALSYIFQLEQKELAEKIKAIHIVNWGKDPYALGGYSYETVESATAKEIMIAPVNDRLFFAGEALYKGSHNGTVEAAFASGRNAAKMMMKS